MQTYDLLMLAILGGLTIYGYFKGMAWQIAYIASFVAGYFVATKYADRLAPSITFVNPPANKFVAMLIIYAVCAFAVWMLFRVVSKAIDSVKMEGFDHQMGAIIGFARGVLWCVGVTFFAVTLLPPSFKQQIIGSQSGRYIARLLDETHSLFPPEVHQIIGPYLDRLENELDGGGAVANGQPAGYAQQPGGWPASVPQTPPSGGASPWPAAPASLPGWPTAGGQQNSPPAAPAGWPAQPQSYSSPNGWPTSPAATPAQPAGFAPNR
ncbi:CvpA family protein [Botrimarina hoheduenensis]|uniref:Colicin V production protein n=1 Tax=Botrimarina hoheduenensis TaxID=2528000 RepID=A0A5C5VV68_9BACT|nr:CvpA family protein [Botrimarina hoheduenensis]TWT41559.1 Colicin V production protein [Botrimarina hoheduenensis]